MHELMNQQTGRNPIDVDLAERVRLSLHAHRRGLRQITVGAKAGTVRLSGSVTSFFLRQMAVETASRVGGVLHVVDDLDVALAPPQLPETG